MQHNVTRSLRRRDFDKTSPVQLGYFYSAIYILFYSRFMEQHRRTRIACKPCRQNKIRCGMRTPPCARCSRLGISCTLDPGFRRVSRGERVQQLESDVEKLRGLLNKQNDMAALSPVSDRSVARSLAHGEHHKSRTPSELETRTELHMGTPGAAASAAAAFEIGPVSLSVEQADRLVAM